MNNFIFSNSFKNNLTSKFRFLPLPFFGIFGLLLLFSSSCTRDFVEKDIANQTVVLDAPADMDSTTITNIIFWWETVDGALKYNLQIAKPNFSNIKQLVLDTNTASNKFSFTLFPGTYEWRVKAFNGSSNTAYSSRKFVIDSTASLSGQTVILVSPDANYTTAKKTNSFKWNKVLGADDYRFQIIDNSNNSKVIDVTIKEDSISHTFTEGSFTWQVRAQNASSNSEYSIRTITVKTTAPKASFQTIPADNDSVANPVSMQWSRNSGTIADSLFIYSDQLLTTKIASDYRTSNDFSFTTGAITKTYYWRLKSVDLAGNWSGYSSVTKFKIYK